MCCGRDGTAYILPTRNSGLTTAHIVPNIEGLDTFFGKCNSYIDDVKAESVANYLVLCGTQGQSGSCHNEYDNLALSLYYSKPDDRYQWVMGDGSRQWSKADGSIIELGVLDPGVVGRKYARLLNWRTIRTLLQPGTKCSLSIAERTNFINNLKTWEEDECDD